MTNYEVLQCGTSDFKGKDGKGSKDATNGAPRRTTSNKKLLGARASLLPGSRTVLPWPCVEFSGLGKGLVPLPWKSAGVR